jgi:hypothetical protein
MVIAVFPRIHPMSRTPNNRGNKKEFIGRCKKTKNKIIIVITMSKIHICT